MSTISCTVNVMKLEIDHDSQGVLVFGKGRVRGEVDCFLLLLLHEGRMRAWRRKGEKEKYTHPGFTEPTLIIEVALLGVL